MNEVKELAAHLASWPALGAFFGVVVVFGFLPGFTLRLLVKLYPPGHVRRDQLPADMYELPRHKRWFFVAEQLETVLFEGLPARLRRRLQVRRFSISRAWSIGVTAALGLVMSANGLDWPVYAMFAVSACIVVVASVTEAPGEGRNSEPDDAKTLASSPPEMVDQDLCELCGSSCGPVVFGLASAAQARTGRDTDVELVSGALCSLRCARVAAAMGTHLHRQQPVLIYQYQVVEQPRVEITHLDHDPTDGSFDLHGTPPAAPTGLDEPPAPAPSGA